MARRRRNKEPSPAAIEAEEEVEVEAGQRHEEMDEMDVDQQEGAHVLQFSQAVTWRAGKPIPVTDLLQRLQTLYDELKDLDQEDAHRKSFEPKAQELASTLLLGHKDSGVRAWTVLCIVEMFRLLAPNAPYKTGQLKEIFSLIVTNIVLALKDPLDAYTAQHLKIIESLNSIKSIVLLTDLPGADKLMQTLFNNAFDVLGDTAQGSNGEHISKNVEFNLTGMLVTLIDESAVLPADVVESLLAQFLRADPSLHPGKRGTEQEGPTMYEVPAAYNMARSVCNSCSEKMVRFVGTYFNGVMIDASEAMAVAKPNKHKSKKRSHDDSDDDSDSGLVIRPSEDDLVEVNKAHRLLRELWRSCPTVIRNVIPQLETELGAENVSLRTLAVETVGDMISGIGAAGPPPPTKLEPAAYPPQSLEPYASQAIHNVLLKPAAPQAFSSVYPTTYETFFDRRNDKSAQVRTAWVGEVGRILLTNGGGKGLDRDQESLLLRRFSDALLDNDEKVRLAAVRAIASFDYHTIITKLGSSGSATTEGSALNNLAARMKDPKQLVRSAATYLVGRIWGVAAGAITEGSEHVRELVGTLPSSILVTTFVNNPSIHADVQNALHESLLPIGYPPIKPKPATIGNPQRIADSQGVIIDDPNRLRVERILTLVRDLDSKAHQVFIHLFIKGASLAKYLINILDEADKVSGELDKKSNKESARIIRLLIGKLAEQFPNTSVATEHLELFVKQYDRRNYALVKFAMSPESDYKKVVNAMKELSKRLETASDDMGRCLPTLLPLLRSVAMLVFNKSHVPAFIEISRTDDKGLAQAAQIMVENIAKNAPTIFKLHVQELCEALQRDAPSSTSSNGPAAVESLKACAGFARRFPHDISGNREFFQAMTKFATRGTPPTTAKHAVTVIVSSADKKDMYIRDIVKTCLKDFKAGGDHYLAKLAALGQLRLLASHQTEDYHDAIDDIAATIIGQSSNEDTADTTEANNVDDILTAKLLSLKIIVNSLRGELPDADDVELGDRLRAKGNRVFRLLNTIIDKEGELSKDDTSTPKSYRIQLRLAAGKLILKLCCDKLLERLLAPRDFNRLTKIVQDEAPEVRTGFNDTLRKYLSQAKLNRKFFSLLFLYAYEPQKDLKERTTTFLGARVIAFSKAEKHGLEGVLSHYFSVLAHHPDFSSERHDLEDFVEYILYYLRIVANEKNLGQLYAVSLRPKQLQDAIAPEKSENLYILSEMAESIIRYFADIKQWSLQITPTKIKMPSALYSNMPSHAIAQEIADKRFLPADLAEDLEDIVKDRMTRKSKKRKADGDGSKKAAKKAKNSAAKVKSEKVRKVPKEPKSLKAKTPKKLPSEDVPSSERRKSTRVSNAKSYADGDSSDDDEELEKWQGRDDEDDEANKENVSSTTPPTSDQTPLDASAKKPTPASVQKHSVSRKAARKKILSTHVTRSARIAAKKKTDEFDLPRDSDGELSDPPSELEA